MSKVSIRRKFKEKIVITTIKTVVKLNVNENFIKVNKIKV